MHVVEVNKDAAVLRVGPNTDFDRLTPQLQGTRLLVEERTKGWFKVRLGPTRTGWIQEGDVTPVPKADRPQFLLKDIYTRATPDSIQVEFALSGHGAVEVVDRETPPHLMVTFDATTLAMMEIRHPEGTDLVRNITLDQTADGVVTACVDLASPRVWGYELHRSDKGVILDIRRPPTITGNLAGVTVVIDPGHGGDDSGAVGRDGLNEKDINLAVSQALRSRLQADGARVVMTRDGDNAVFNGPKSKDNELAARVDVSRKARGTIFISVHHNAMPRVDDARVAHGSEVYYFQAQSRALAQALAGTVGASIEEPAGSYRWRSFHVIRQTAVPAVLVEVQYISNPDMEARMRNPDYPDTAAGGIYLGIRPLLFGLEPRP